MLILYSVPESLYSAKLRIILRTKGIEFEQKSPPGGYGSDQYKSIVPAGTVPAIVHDGFVLADSEAIAEYIEDVWPTPALLPEDAKARARARERSRFHDTRLEPEIRSLFGQVAPHTRDADFVSQKASLITTRLAQLGILARDHAHSMTLGDCGFPISFIWLDAFFPAIGAEITWTDEVCQYRHWLEGNAAVQQELADYLPVAREWTARKLGQS